MTTYTAPWRRKNKRPCGLLYNTGHCPDQSECLFSHDARDVQSWRLANGSKPCVYDLTCDKLPINKCIYTHSSDALKSANGTTTSPGHHSGTDRLALITAGLTLLESLDQWPAGCANERSPAAAAVRNPVAVPVGIRNERVLASYSKLADNKIAVPGMPPQFVPPAAGLCVKLDAEKSGSGSGSGSGGGTNCKNTYPTYTHSLEPLVRAVQCMHPSGGGGSGGADAAADLLASTHIMANVGSLYRLFHYLAGVASMAQRFDLEWRPAKNSDGDGDGGTLLMQHWAADPNHQVSYGRGNNFESMTCHLPEDAPAFLQAAYTHHHVVAYGFGALQCVVHCEIDGYYNPAAAAAAAGAGKLSAAASATQPTPTSFGPAGLPTPPVSPRMAQSQTQSQPQPSPSPQPSLTPPPPPSPVMSLLGSRFAVLDLEGSDPPDATVLTPSPTLEITHHPGTRIVPADHLVEIKTYQGQWARTQTRMRNKAAAANKTVPPLFIAPEPQLYFGRTRQLYSAAHIAGRFGSSSGSKRDRNLNRVRDMAGTMRKWEHDQQAVLARVYEVLQHVRKTVADMATKTTTEHGGGGHTKFSLVCPKATAGEDTPPPPMQLYVRDDDAVSFLPPGM